MISMTLAEISAAVDGALQPAGDHVPDTIVDGSVQTDSRLLDAGSVFFALRGEATDGHLFVEAAAAARAAVLIVEHPVDVAVTQIVVADGLAALAALAREVVARVRAGGGLTVVGITGSNGKTTTKNMLREVFGRAGNTVAPEGSFNNHVGAPLSMLRIDETTRYLVVEMGASGPGEIARTVAIATPDIGVVLTVGLAHAGEFGGIEVTQRTKAEMVTDLPSTATAVLNIDDGRVASMASLTAATVVWFGLDARAEVRATDIEATAGGTAFTLHVDGLSIDVRLRILGEHHVMNALAAITVARAAGVPVADAVAAIESLARAERWRMEVLTAPTGTTVINDAYNASPDSMSAALKTLALITRGTERRSVAVLGEMAELGPYADEEHDRIGRLAVRLNVQRLIVVGHGARHIHNAAGLEGSWDGESVLVQTAEEAWALLDGTLLPSDIVLVKSSKSAGLRFLGDRLGGVEGRA